ncbi:MAG: Fic family protein [Bdellovibrionota bacterium]
MKNFTLFIVSLWIASVAAADCDSFLRLPQENARKASLYMRDCEIQDRYQKLQTYFTSEGINVAELAEYRLLRFVDRNSYEKAQQLEMSPSQIYKPAPTTWNVWDSGIRSLFGDDQIAQILFKSNGFNSKAPAFEYLNFAMINGALLKNNSGDISRDHLTKLNRRMSKPGTYRKDGDPQVGWTTYSPDSQDKVSSAQNSMLKAQQDWEVEYGMSFNEVIKKYNGLLPNAATFSVPMTVSSLDGGKSFEVAYAPGKMVSAQISWLNTFVKASIERYRANKPIMPPIEFSALVQKWLVTIHPFADGNGRTSRAVQDFILATFKMPYAPGGDLQNDTLEEFDKYVDLTYDRMEAMVVKLEACAQEYRQKQKPSYGCRTVKSMETGN